MALITTGLPANEWEKLVKDTLKLKPVNSGQEYARSSLKQK